LTAFALAHAGLTGPWAATSLHALQLVAVAVVAHAVLAMQRNLAPNAPRLAVATVGVASALLLPAPVAGIGTITLGAISGLLFFRNTATLQAPGALRSNISARAGALCLTLFVLLLILPPLFPSASLTVFSVFYRAGALVFALALLGLWLLTVRRQAPWKIVALTLAATLLLHAILLHLSAPAWLQI
jgi:chromate transporter